MITFLKIYANAKSPPKKGGSLSSDLVCLLQDESGQYSYKFFRARRLSIQAYAP